MKCSLFLDFDGAVHPVNCLSSRFFCCLPLVEDVLRQHVNVQVVISSSWRERQDLEQLRAGFAPDMRDRVVDVTPQIKSLGPRWAVDKMPPYERQWECLEWIRLNEPAGAPWVAIDDQADLFEPNCPQLLLTKSHVGFEARQAERLDAMLKAWK